MGKDELNLNDKSYIVSIIERKEWVKLLDPYTLNRLMKFYLQLNESTNGGILLKQQGLQYIFLQSLKRFTINWTVYSLIGYRSSGIWTYIFYLWRENSFLSLKLAILSFYILLSINSSEQVLFIFLLEMTLILLANSAFVSILKDLKGIAAKESKRIRLVKERHPLKTYHPINTLYWSVYFLVYNYFFNYQIAIILIIGWIYIRAKYFRPNISLVLLSNMWSIVSGAHPFHLFLLNSLWETTPLKPI